MHNFNPITLLTKGYLQQLADGFLIVDDENIRHLASGFLDCSFCALHSASRNSRELDDKLSAAIFFGYHANLSTVGLHNLIDNGQPQAGAALETRLQRLENLGPLFLIEADTRVLKSDAQPERTLFHFDGQSAAIRHCP